MSIPRQEQKTAQKSENDSHEMNCDRFKISLARLGYNVSTANQLLGIGRTSIYRIAKGLTPAPMVVVKLLDMYERHGIPEEHR